MNSTSSKITCLSVLLLAMVLVAAGCAGSSKIKAKPWNVSITKKVPASIEVDLIGIAETEKLVWEGYSIDKYWTPGDPRRASADKLTESLEMGTPWKIDAKNPQWNKWINRGAKYLVIIARLPGRFEPGPADPRRVVLSLDKRAWEGKTLEFEVYDAEIRPLTAPK